MNRIPLGSKYLSRSYCSWCALWWKGKPRNCPDCNRKTRQVSKDKKKDNLPKEIVRALPITNTWEYEGREVRMGPLDSYYDSQAIKLIWREFE